MFAPSVFVERVNNVYSYNAILLYYMRIGVYIYSIYGWFFCNKNPKSDSSRDCRVLLMVFLSEKKWVGELKKVKYYFPPPLFELSELNRISF